MSSLGDTRPFLGLRLRNANRQSLCFDVSFLPYDMLLDDHSCAFAGTTRGTSHAAGDVEAVDRVVAEPDAEPPPAADADLAEPDPEWCGEGGSYVPEADGAPSELHPAAREAVWRTDVMARWSRPGHINVLEGEAYLLTIKHICRN